MEYNMKYSALRYAGYGLRVHPMHAVTNGVCSCVNGAKCKSSGKHPMYKGWVNDSTTDKEVISKWWDKNRNANIGMLCGKDNGIFVLDIDVKNDGYKTLESLITKYGKFPKTVTQISGGGGRHYLFKYPQNIKVPNLANFMQGIDLRSDGGQIVVAPSLHASGKRYAWLPGHEFEEVEIAESPKWLLNLIIKQQNKQSKPLYTEKISDGNRNSTLTSIAGKLRAKGLGQAEIESELMVINKTQCLKPLENNEVVRIARSVASYPSTAENVKNILSKNYNKLSEILTNDVLKSLAYAKNKLPLDYITFKAKVKENKLSIREIENAIKEYDKYYNVNNEQLQENKINVCGKDIIVPSGYILSLDDGIYMHVKEGKSIVCFNLVIIDERLINIDTGIEKVRLKFYRDGKWKDVVEERATIFNKASIIKLANVGLAVSSGNASKLVSYLDSYEQANKDNIKAVKCVSKLGWRGQSFLPYHCDDNAVKFEPDSDFTIDILKGITQKGSLEEWKRGAEIVKKSSCYSRFMLACSFASPLLKLLEHRTFISYVWCKSKHGKSASIKMGISAFGDPNKLQSSFNTTLVGLERKCAGLNNLPFGIDERQLLDEKKMDVARICYLMAEEQSKVKGEKFGGLADVLTWRNIVIASGEQSLTNSKSQDGVQTRVVELYGKPLVNGAIAKQIHIISNNNYGQAGQIYINKLCEYMKDNDIKVVLEYVTDKLKPYVNNSEHLDDVAVVCVGDALSSMFVFDEEKSIAFKNAISMGKEILANNSEQLRDSNTERAYAFIIDWLGCHSAKFKGETTECYGIMEGDMYFVIPSILDKALVDNGYDVSQTIKAMKENGRLVTKIEAGRETIKPVKKINGNAMRVYKIKNTIKEKELKQMQMAV